MNHAFISGKGKCHAFTFWVMSRKKRSNTLIKESFILIIKTVETESGEIILPVATQQNSHKRSQASKIGLPNQVTFRCITVIIISSTKVGPLTHWSAAVHLIGLLSNLTSTYSFMHASLCNAFISLLIIALPDKGNTLFIHIIEILLATQTAANQF